MTGGNCRLCAGKFGFAFGLIWALGILLMGWAGWLWAYGLPVIQLMSSVYLGYSATFLGAIWGAIWGFVDAFIFGLLVAWVYNCCCKCCKSSSGES